MTRVALLGPASSIHLQRWAAALALRGHALCVISQQRCERALLPASAEVAWLPHAGTPGYVLNALPLRRLLARWRPDLLHANYASGYGTTAALCAFGPSLLSVWGSDVYEFPFESALKGRLLRWNLRRATTLASTSHAMAKQVRRLTPERTEIAVTPFGVDLARFVPQKGEREAGVVTIGIVKSLAPTYGVDILLRAFAGLLADGGVAGSGLECRLIVVGDGPQRDELIESSHRLGIQANTWFVGGVAHSEVSTWLNRFDVYAAPSRAESFGVAVIEASACGLPVVVSDAGGLPEVVRDNETGLVVPREDVPALQAALKRLILDPALRERLGREGRAHVMREFDWEHCVDLMEHAYALTVAAGRAR